MLKIEDIITDKSIKSFTDERRTDYENRTIVFLRQEFEPALRLLNDDQVRKVVQLAYKNAKKRGITTEKEHLKYLIPVMFWGSYFENNPQYHTVLIETGWLSNEFEPTKAPSIDQLIKGVDKWFLQVQPDLKSQKDIFRKISEIYVAKLPERLTPEQVCEILYYVWPNYFSAMGANRARLLMIDTVNRYLALQSSFRDTLVFSCFSVYFGIKFDEDPRFPWVGRILENSEYDLDYKRTILFSSIRQYFDYLSPTKEMS